MKKQRNIRKKSEQNLQKRRFPAYFRHFRPEKNFSPKSDSVMFRTFLIRIFEQKIRKNKWWNLAKMPKNRFFRYISSIFGRKISFSEIGLRNILDITILHQCAKFHEKILSTAREIQEIPFFRRQSAVPASKISFLDN